VFGVQVDGIARLGSKRLLGTNVGERFEPRFRQTRDSA
jgi:hypothetical protein